MTSDTQFMDEMRAHTINLLRDQILENIYNPTLTPLSTTAWADREALKREYNRLSNELESIKQAPPMDPLAHLPPEVWTEIIRETAEENGVNLPPTDVLFLLTLVSREWCAKILGTARLWTSITVGRGEADAQAKLASALYFTKHVKFGITIDVPPYEWEDSLSLLQAHTPRVEKIAFRFSEGSYFYGGPTLYKYIDNLFASLGHLPSLKILHGPEESRLSWDGVFEKCPNLTYIYETMLPLEVLQTQNPVPVRACRVEASWHEIIPSLGNLGYLEELEWRPKFGTGVDVDRKYGSLPALPALERVLIMGNNVQPPHILILLRLTERLTRLRFKTESNWQSLHDFFFLLEHLCHLRDLELELEDIINLDFSFPVNRLAKTGVQNLRLTTSIALGPEKNAAFMNQENLFSIFSMCFPDVRQLELVFTFLGPKAVAYIQSATHLLSLTL